MTLPTPDILYLIKGAAKTVEIELLDERDEAEDLTNITPTEFSIRTALGTSGKDLIRITSGLTKDANIVSVTLSATDADALRVGRFVGGLKVDNNGEADWTDPFYVEVLEPST